MTKSIWGWGGIKFVYGLRSVEFLTSFCDLGFTPVKIARELTDGTLYEKLRGFRANLTVDMLNYDDGDSDKIVTFISMINDSMAANEPIVIYPKYETPDTGQNWSGTFRIDSDIAFEDVVKNVFVGQRSQLRFIGNALIPTMPDNTSDTDQVLRKHGVATDTYRVYDSADSTTFRKSEG